MDCSQLTPYLDRHLTEEDRKGFEVHLQRCHSCQRQVESWHTLAAVLQAKDTRETAKRIVTPTPHDIEHLVRHAASLQEAKKSPTGILFPATFFQGRRKTVFILAAAAAVLIALVITLLWHPKANVADTQHQIATPVRTSVPASTATSATQHSTTNARTDTPTLPQFAEATRDLTTDETIRTADSGGQCIHIRTDTVCLYPNSRADVTIEPDAHHVQLVFGQALFYVKPKQARQFTVHTPNSTITVVGTQFSVFLPPDGATDVVVKKGTVQVDGNGRRERVNGGTAATVATGVPTISTRIATEPELMAFSPLNAHVSPEPDETGGVSAEASVHPHTPLHDPSSVNTWKQKMIEGEIDDAATGLTTYLSLHPTDAEAMFLLATCKKRQGDPKEALALYQKLVRYRNPSISNRAAYLAGDVCLHQLFDPSCALRYYSPFLQNSPADAPHRAEASFYKAEALLQLGRKKEAEQTLETVVQTYGRTAIGQRAQNRLRTLQP
ncbi:MAG: tetratricopeptide repeat protein [Deltaproteobacteria bacterium]|nr:tetratricopeptide repeat protein [Deltaproteobacteria bacterium]